MEFEQLAASLTPEIIDRLRAGVECGKWPNGQPLTPNQREQAMAAVLVWEARHRPMEQRTGYMAQHCKNSKNSEQDDSFILRFQDS